MKLTSLPNAAAVCLCAIALSACDATQPGASGLIGSNSGTLESNVEIFEGTTFTATWRSSGTTVVRLAYQATTAVTDAEAIEIAERLSGCRASSDNIQTELVGGLASVRIAAVCGGQAEAPREDTEETG